MESRWRKSKLSWVDCPDRASQSPVALWRSRTPSGPRGPFVSSNRLYSFSSFPCLSIPFLSFPFLLLRVPRFRNRSLLLRQHVKGEPFAQVSNTEDILILSFFIHFVSLKHSVFIETNIQRQNKQKLLNFLFYSRNLKPWNFIFSSPTKLFD